ncbi:MAG: tyrosine-protein phosphatase [Geobacteraceae bacterium]|nr:tyrosine-protein phosphatase [Geobacteraceae bacterium]
MRKPGLIKANIVVRRMVIMKDYLCSKDYILSAYRKNIDAFVAVGGDSAIPSAILTVKKDWLEAAFDERKKKYGT